jgi:hypothetical protein
MVISPIEMKLSLVYRVKCTVHSAKWSVAMAVVLLHSEQHRQVQLWGYQRLYPVDSSANPVSPFFLSQLLLVGAWDSNPILSPLSVANCNRVRQLPLPATFSAVLLYQVNI